MVPRSALPWPAGAWLSWMRCLPPGRAAAPVATGTRVIWGRAECPTQQSSLAMTSAVAGTALELLVLFGVPLFAIDADGLARQLASGQQLLALLPDRVRPDTRRPDDDF